MRMNSFGATQFKSQSRKMHDNLSGTRIFPRD